MVTFKLPFELINWMTIIRSPHACLPGSWNILRFESLIYLFETTVSSNYCICGISGEYGEFTFGDFQVGSMLYSSSTFQLYGNVFMCLLMRGAPIMKWSKAPLLEVNPVDRAILKHHMTYPQSTWFGPSIWPLSLYNSCFLLKITFMLIPNAIEAKRSRLPNPGFQFPSLSISRGYYFWVLTRLIGGRILINIAEY